VAILTLQPSFFANIRLAQITAFPLAFDDG